jgi:S-DNA-T family DNA segregation ATPase FtsK/SpoIIIE
VTRSGSRRRTPSTRRTRRTSGPTIRISPEVVRSLVGIVLLVLGVVILIGLMLPGEGALTDWIRDVIAPWFGTGRWLLPFLLIGGGIYVQRASGPRSGWPRVLAGGALAYLSFLGLLSLLVDTGFLEDRSGGRIGDALARALSTLVTPPGAFVVLVAAFVAGIIIMLDRPVRSLLERPVAGIRSVGTAVASAASAPSTGEAPAAAAPPSGKTPTKGPVSQAASPGQAGLFGEDEPTGSRSSVLDQPAPRTSPTPISQTVWAHAGGSDAGGGGPGDAGGPAVAGAVLAGSATATARSDRGATGGVGDPTPDDQPRPSDAGRVGEPTVQEALARATWSLPTVDMLEERAPGRPGSGVDHEWNIRRIEEKLNSFQIPAKVVATNSGPVVTQYEVRPDAHVKLSRIEALADDLAMALAARSIRIEAPIPGKDVVGIEIPNQASEVVGFRPLVEETRMLEATSPLTFALGRDVSGKAYAVDLAKMPHLLVAGATGSGKSVCVNALITSLLMRARPDEVRMVLVDLKRVELAPYNGLPHLLQHVIVEPGEAKAVLNWAVHEMEDRYKALAAHTVRNIAAFNARPDLAPDERMPYIVLIIDELADLIMREGRKVEDPVVKIAQKARAVGIHLVLATQRPSVNVVTGLIKANVPSRIAFAMASMVDSRTVLDSPGAEDLIGRGDMLYQPVDLPRPVRLQGVFVSDREVSAVTQHWTEQTAGRTYYDEDILAFADGDGDNGNGGQFAWLAKLAEDDMTVRAAELVTSTQRASTSMLQTKLKLGFARASRVIDELERYGVVGPQDPRNPATPRAVYGPDNWFRSLDDIDDPGS